MNGTEFKDKYEHKFKVKITGKIRVDLRSLSPGSQEKGIMGHSQDRKAAIIKINGPRHPKYFTFE